MTKTLENVLINNSKISFIPQLIANDFKLTQTLSILSFLERVRPNSLKFKYSKEKIIGKTPSLLDDKEFLKAKMLLNKFKSSKQGLTEKNVKNWKVRQMSQMNELLEKDDIEANKFPSFFPGNLENVHKMYFEENRKKKILSAQCRVNNSFDLLTLKNEPRLKNHNSVLNKTYCKISHPFEPGKVTHFFVLFLT